MALASLIAEFDKETRTTRRLLERIPADRFDWRPHPKSFIAGGLASHIVDCVGWVESIFSSDELDIDPATFRMDVASPGPTVRPPTTTPDLRP